MKFKADYNGTITGIRFYKATANTGTHIGSLWTTDGTRLATATFTNETASGWQTVTFATPVSVTAARPTSRRTSPPPATTPYTGSGFATAIDNGPLHASPTASAPTASTTLGHQRLPDEHVQRDELLGRRAVRAARARSAHRRDARAAGSTSAMVHWTAPASAGP